MSDLKKDRSSVSTHDDRVIVWFPGSKNALDHICIAGDNETTLNIADGVGSAEGLAGIRTVDLDGLIDCLIYARDQMKKVGTYKKEENK